MGHYINGIPTALSEREAQILRIMTYDKYVVEVGALLGFSTINMAKGAHFVWSIDRHTGYDSWPNNTYKDMMRNLQVHGVSSKVRVIREDYTAMDYEYIHKKIDFTFIDLDGCYFTTLDAIDRARSKFIGVHDFERQGCRGVAKAIEKTLEDKRFSVLERVDSLVILRRAV